MTRTIPRSLVAFVTTILAALALTLSGTAPQSQALPPGGAGGSTPGTSSTVSDSVEVGGIVEFSLSGFPVGSTVSIKLDDGQGYSDQGTQFTGVVHQAVVPGSGTVSGSFQLPSFVEPGTHWLRFLTSVEVESGDGQEGYTNKSPNFTVVPAGSSGSNSDGGSQGGSSNGGSRGGSNSDGGSGNSQGGGVVYVDEQGATITRDAEVEEEEADEADDESNEALVIDGSQAATASAAPSSAAKSDDSAKTAEENEGSGFPVVGVIVLLVAILAVAAGVVLALRSRKQSESAATTPAPEDEDPEATTEFKAQ